MIVLVLGLALLAGCSDNSQEQASSNIREQVAQSQQLFERAVWLMSAPVMVVDGETAPVMQPGDAPVTVLPPDAVNPKALDALEAAENGLVEVLNANADAASRESQAMGHFLLGRIEALKANYYRQLASQARNAAVDLITDGQGWAASLRMQADSIKLYNQLAAQSTQDVQQVMAQAKAAAAEASKNAENLSGQIDKLQAERAELMTRRSELMAQASDLKRKARLAAGDEGLEMVDRAVGLQEQAQTAERRISAIDQQLESLAVEQATQQLAAVSAESRLELASAVIDAREKAASAIDRGMVIRPGEQRAVVRDNGGEGMVVVPGRADLQARLAETRKQLAELSQKAGEAFQAAAEYEVEALNVYQPAVAQLRKAESLYASLDDDQNEALMAFQRAETLMSRADMQLDRLTADAQAEKFAQEVREAFEAAGGDLPTEALTTITGYVDGETVKGEAIETVEEVEQIHATGVLARFRGNTKWLYQGQLGAAYLRLYRITGEQRYRADAQRVLSEATENKEASPYLREVVALRRQAEGRQDAPEQD
jgi:hypothetical protein